MAFSLGLLTKGLLGTSAVTAATVSIVFKDQIGEEISNLFISKDSLNKKITGLGIDQSCLFDNDDLADKTCTLDADKFKKITFVVKSGADAKATTSGTISVELKIEKLNYKGYSKDFPSALRFTLKNTQDSDLDIGTDSNKITLKKDIKTDFKIKDGTKLEKAWTLETLGAKVGLSCPNDGTASECSLTNNGTINVWKANDDYITGAKGDTSKKMTVEKDQKDYLDGLKFTVKDSNDITLEGGTKKKETDGIDKLTKTNKAYEIDLKDYNGTKKWFLVEKSAASSVPQESQ